MEFSNVSDEVLKVELNKIIHEYRKSKKIEEIILEIIYDLGYSKKLPINHELDNRFKKITKVSELRKIDQPKKMGKIIITKEDIIKALYEKFRQANLCGFINACADTGWYVLDANVETSSVILSKQANNEEGCFIDVREIEPETKKDVILNSIDAI